MLRSRIASSCRRVQPQSRINLPCSLCHTRFYATPTNPVSTPAAAVAESASPVDPSILYSSRRNTEEPHRFNPPKYHKHTGSRLHLPSPLPIDVQSPVSSLQAELYKPTSAIDTIAMLSICSSRPEFVPRAYQIFTQLLADAKAGSARYPDAEVWANVIRGVASLGKPGTHPQEEHTAGLWRHRALQLVWEWELSNGGTRGVPFPGNDGIRVYSRWLSGLISVNAPLDSILPYIENPSLGLLPVLEGLRQAELDTALIQLREFAKRNARSNLLQQIKELQNVEREKKQIQEREVIPEITPVLEKAKKPKARALSQAPEITETDTSSMPSGARFAITNLRETLKQIQTPLTAYNRQMQLEKASYDAAEAELAHAAKQLEEAGLSDVAEAQRLQRDVLQSHMHRWHGQLTEFLENDIKAMRERVKENELTSSDLAAPKWTSSTKMRDSSILLYLTVLPPKKLALITILELMRMVGSGGVTDGMKVLRGLLAVGKAVETEHRADTIRSVAGTDSQVWHKILDPQTQKPNRQQLNNLWAKVGKERDEATVEEQQTEVDVGEDPSRDLRSVWTPPWSQMVQMSVGSHLVDALVKVAKVRRTGRDPLTGEEVTEEQPAFSHAYEYVRGRKLGVIRLNPAIAARLANDSIRQMIHPKHLPMLVPPRPWNQWNDGAYLATRVSAMRFKDSVEQVNYLREASRKDHLTPVFHGLDVLSSTPWAINRKVFDVVLEAWNSGEAIADIPATAEKCNYNFPDKPDPRDNDPGKRSQYVERLKAATVQQRKDHGERCKYNYNLEIARAYLNDVFYIPHNMDFRGRAYPIPPHLSPVGDDLSRGLLTFGIKKPLGSTGLKWLQIHLANLYGFDKASFEDRARFSQQHEAEIFDSADDPLGGKRWWLAAEDPWQCLATCFELAAALRSADPTKYESSLPVHQDGTCNGMQHYAALGGDVRGAKAVNLEKGDRPADIYTSVLELVNKSIEEDQKNNVPVSLLIKEPLGRKVIKQTVMTTVYGVTFIGARDQIAKQLVARGDFSADDIYLVSAYIAKKVLSSIGDLFSGARAIQDWLTLSARLIARSIPPHRVEAAVAPPPEKKSARSKKSTPASRLARELMTSVIWTSPLGLPVVQPYRKAVKKQVMTSLQTVYISDPNAPAEVSPQKQATAFPPNFVHSLDATHMLLTSVKCNQSNITFASVHDSYWTHAATVEPMSEAIRDTFIHLHTQDLIGELHQEFVERYGDHCIPVNNAKSLKTAAAKRKARLDEVAAEADAHAATQAPPGTFADLSSTEITDSAAEMDDEASETVKDGEEGIDASEVGDSVPEEVIGNQRFVRFRDVLPPTPAKGVFDVERIRESAYFFS